MTDEQKMISDLLDVVLDELARHEERIGYLQRMKAKLEKLIKEDDDE